MKAAWGLGFKKIYDSEVRDVIDKGVHEVLKNLGPTPMDFEVERILRMGACGTRGYRTYAEDAYRRLGVSQKTMKSDLRRHSMPTVAKLLAWGHLIPVLGLKSPNPRMSQTGSLDKLSIHWGFDSGGSISSKCKEYAGVYPSAIKGGVTDLAKRLVSYWRKDLLDLPN